jgi:citrate lyase subunit beta/citryl-CoA lyase
VAIINEVFSASAEQVAFYEGMVTAYEDAASQGHGALRYEGLHIDKAHYDKAVLWLQQARRAGASGER